VHDQSHSIFIIALYTITQNASKSHQLRNIPPNVRDLRGNSKNNMDTPPLKF